MKTHIGRHVMKSLDCGDMNKSKTPRMKTRRVVPLLFTLALACFFNLPANKERKGRPIRSTG